jgi:hypothetical protein
MGLMQCSAANLTGDDPSCTIDGGPEIEALPEAAIPEFDGSAFDASRSILNAAQGVGPGQFPRSSGCRPGRS